MFQVIGNGVRVGTQINGVCGIQLLMRVHTLTAHRARRTGTQHREQYGTSVIVCLAVSASLTPAPPRVLGPGTVIAPARLYELGTLAFVRIATRARAHGHHHVGQYAYAFTA